MYQFPNPCNDNSGLAIIVKTNFPAPSATGDHQHDSLLTRRLCLSDKVLVGFVLLQQAACLLGIYDRSSLRRNFGKACLEKKPTSLTAGALMAEMIQSLNRQASSRSMMTRTCQVNRLSNRTTTSTVRSKTYLPIAPVAQINRRRETARTKPSAARRWPAAPRRRHPAHWGGCKKIQRLRIRYHTWWHSWMKRAW